MMALLVALCSLVAFAGFALLAFGVRGRRVDDHPLCRACGFDLTGATSARCPECGRETTRPRIGHRRRRALPLTIGASLTAIVLLGGGTIGVGVARGVDWRDKLPTAWLLREATRGAVADRADPIARLLARDAASPLPTATRVALARAIIAVQPDATIAWQPTWGDWVAARIVDGKLPPDARDAFVRELFANVTIDVRQAVRRGEELPLAVRVASPRNRCTYAVALDDVFDEVNRTFTVDGTPMPAPAETSNASGFLGVMTGLNFAERGKEWRAIGVGRHAVEWSCAIALRAKGGAPDGPPLAVVPVAWRGEVTVVDADGDAGVRPVPDPGGLLREAIGNASIRMPTTRGTAMLDLRFATTLPFGVAADVFVRQDGGAEQRAVSITRAPAAPATPYSWGLYDVVLRPGVAELIVRANPAVARRTTDLHDVWSGELRIEDVPVIDTTREARDRSDDSAVMGLPVRPEECRAARHAVRRVTIADASMPFDGKPILGIVGGIGSGKSTVSGVFASLGCCVIDSDAAAHATYAMPAVIATLRAWHGDDVIRDGVLDRRAVARRVFSDRAERDRLEALLHPLIHERRRVDMDARRGDASVRAFVWDSPLLFEAGLDRECDGVIFVDTPLAVREARVLASRGWPAGELARREANQLALEAKRARSNWVIRGDATIDATRAAATSIVEDAIGFVARASPP